jgi:hypothetical protein
MNIKANGSRKLFFLAAICLVLLLLAYLLFDSRLQPPSLVIKSVRGVGSGRKAICEALLCLTNGGRHEVVFQTGINESPSFITLMWFGVEKKQNGRWVLESQSKDPGYIWDAHRFKPGKAIDFRAYFPADGQTRRLVVHWRPTSARLASLLTRIRRTWQKLASAKPAPGENFIELRSAELVLEKSLDSDGAAFNSMAEREYKPWALSNVADGPLAPSDLLRRQALDPVKGR